MSKYRFLEDKHIHQIDRGNGWENLNGTSTVPGVISKELTWWASGMCAEQFGWLNKKYHTPIERAESALAKRYFIHKLTDAEYLNYIEQAYRAHHDFKEKRATEGTDLHGLAESYIKNKMEGYNGDFESYSPLLHPFIKWCDKNVKRFLFSEIHCYSEKLWIGGITDFGFEDIDGHYVLADIKSRDKDYFTDHVQCGGYDIQLCENGGFDKDGNKTWDFNKTDDGGDLIAHGFSKHAIFTLGEKFKEPVFSDPTRNIEAFKFALGLYKLKKEYDDGH